MKGRLVALVAVVAFMGAVLAAPLFWPPTARGANIAAVSAGTTTVSGLTSGDVNRDGTVNSIDALLVLQLSAGLLPPWAAPVCCPWTFEGYDVNDDGVADSVDATLILQYVAGLIPKL